MKPRDHWDWLDIHDCQTVQQAWDAGFNTYELHCFTGIDEAEIYNNHVRWDSLYIWRRW